MSEPDANAQGMAGLGGGRLDAIFRRNAQRRLDALALIDPPNRAAFTDGEPRHLTYAEAERAVERLAAMLRELGLPPRAPVALQLPTTVEAIIALLAVLRAGLVAAPLPLLWRRAEGAAALAQIGARAIITCGRVGDADHGGIALQMAADTFSIRYVCGFGEVPDGVVPLDAVFSEADVTESAANESEAVDDAAMAIVTFDTATGAAAARGQTALLVGGLAVVLEADLPRHARLLNTMLPSSFAALATAVVPWILTGGTLTLHHPFDASILAAQMRAESDAVIMPGALALQSDLSRADAHLIALWRDPQRQLQSEPWPRNASLTDVLAFGETGLIAARRGADGAPTRLTTGPRSAPHGSPNAPVVMQIVRTADGTLALGGPMLPVSMPDPGSHAPANGIQDTRYPCRLDPANGALTITGAPAGIVNVGGYCFVMSALQETVMRIGGEGVLAALPDGRCGC
jgi:hypothetical protein